MVRNAVDIGKITNKKLKIKARKMMSKIEIKKKVPIFQSRAWEKLKEQIRVRLERKRSLQKSKKQV